jgi:DNA-binding transcriptional LysR family regulator
VAKQLHRSPRGLLRVNVPFSYGLNHIMPLVAEFLSRYPLVRVDMRLDDQVVEASGFDVTVRMTRSLRDSSLRVRKLGENRLVVCAAPRYLARYGVPRTPAELQRHRCLTYANLTSPNTWRFGPGKEMSITVSTTFQTNSGEAMRDAAIAGLGLAQLPEFVVAKALSAGSLRTVLVDYERPAGAIVALYAPGRVPAKVRAFVDFLAARLGATSDGEDEKQGSER